MTTSRPEFTPCEGDGCRKVLKVGRRGPVRRFCRACRQLRYDIARSRRIGAGLPMSPEEMDGFNP